MQSLTEEQKRRFVRDGFLHVPGAVPPRAVTRARRAINHSLGAGIADGGFRYLHASGRLWGCMARSARISHPGCMMASIADGADAGRTVARCGVPECWIVDPAHRGVEVHALEDG